MADKVKEETLKAKVKKYFDLYASIRARKLSGDWDAKRTKLVGDGSVGTNEYGDLFNVLEAFYDAVTASNMFDGIANLDFLTQDQIQALNAAVETIKVNDHDVSAEILRTNGVLSPLTMAMGALDQEERLIDIQAQLSASKLADDIKEELAVKLEQLDEALSANATGLKDFITDRERNINQSTDLLISSLISDYIRPILDRVGNINSDEVMALLTDKATADTLNSTLFQAIFDDIDASIEAVAELNEALRTRDIATSAEITARATEIVSTLTTSIQDNREQLIEELNNSFGKGSAAVIGKLKGVISTEHDFNALKFKEIIDSVYDADQENRRQLAEIQAKLDAIQAAQKKGNRKLAIALTASVLAAILALGITDVVLDATHRHVTVSEEAPIVHVLTDDEVAALQFGGLENAEFNNFLNGLITSPATLSTINTREAAVDQNLGYSLDGNIITSNVEGQYDISTLEGKQAFSDALHTTYENTLQAGGDLAAVANEYMNAARLDDWTEGSTWGSEAYATYNSTDSMQQMYSALTNQEKHTDADLEKHTDADLEQHTEEYLNSLGDAAIDSLYVELAENGLVSGDATTTADKRAEILNIQKESHTDADLEQHTEEYLNSLGDAAIDSLYAELAEKGLVSGSAATTADKKAEILNIEKEQHTADELNKMGDAAIDALYAELAEKGLVSGSAATTADKRAEILNIQKESHTAEDLEQHSKEEMETLRKESAAYKALRAKLESYFDGDVSNLTDVQLVEALFNSGVSDEILEVIVESLYGACGLKYDTTKTPLENWNALSKHLGLNAEIENGNVDQDTPNPNYQERQ